MNPLLAACPLVMNFFLGAFTHKVDGKGRVFVPRPILDAVERPEERAHFFLTLGLDDCLCLFTQEGFNSHLKSVGPSAFGDEASRGAALGLGSVSRKVPVDSQGRILLPDDLRARVGISAEVAVIGALDHVQIWDAGIWKKGRAAEAESAFRSHAPGVFGGDANSDGEGR